jgi:hypothetical protein
MSFGRRKDGRFYRKHRSLYGSPKHKELAAHISQKNPTEARESVHYLDRKWEMSGSRKERVLLVQAANQEANRAKADLNRRDLSEHERHNLTEIQGIYRGFVNEHKGKE